MSASPVPHAYRPTRLWSRWRLRTADSPLGRLSPQVWTLLFLGVVYAEVMTFLSYLRYLGFLTNAWDLGIFQQALWTTGHGDGLLRYTVELPWNPGGSFLGVHFSPILFALVPAYTLAPGPATLMAVQAVALAASAFPLYGLAARRIGPWPGCVLAALYLISPPIVGGLLFDFHVEAFLPLFALTLWFAWEGRRYRLALVAAAFLLATLEYGPVLLGGIALSLFGHRLLAAWRDRSNTDWRARLRPLWVPLLVALASLPLTLLLFHVPKWIEPATPPVGQIGPLGGSVSDILVNSLIHPSLILSAVQVYGVHKLQYLETLGYAGLFVWPLGILDALPALPWIFIALVSTDPNYSVAVGNQYAFLVAPFLFVGTASAIGWLWRQRAHLTGWLRPIGRRLGRRRPWSLSRRLAWWTPPVAVIVMVVAATPGQLLYSPLSPNTHYSWLWAGQFPTARDLDKAFVVGLIPDHASVSAEPDLFPQVANRPNAYPYYEPGTQYLVVDVTSWWFTTALPPPMPALRWIDELRSNLTDPYGMVAAYDGILLYEKDYQGPLEYFRPYLAQLPPGDFAVTNATFSAGGGSPFGSFLNPDINVTNGSIWKGPRLILPPGQFVLSIWVHPRPNASGAVRIATALEGSGTLASVDVWTPELRDAWAPIVEQVTVPYSGYLNVTGAAFGATPAVQFGGISVAEVNTPVQIGP